VNDVKEKLQAKTASKHQAQSNAHGLYSMQAHALLLHILFTARTAAGPIDLPWSNGD